MTLKDILKRMKAADYWDYYNQIGLYPYKTINITTDDMQADRREVLSVKIYPDRRSAPVVIEKVELSGYDIKKNRWTEYRPQGTHEETSKRGEKALMEYIKATMKSDTGYITTQFTHYKGRRV